MKNEIKIAIPKGYLFDQCVDILKKAGYKVEALMEKNRKLSIYSGEDSIQYIISRPMDIPVYVEHGACDVGFSGKDALMEKESNVYELLDLKSGKCRIILATLKDRTEKVKEQYRHFGSSKSCYQLSEYCKKIF